MGNKLSEHKLGTKKADVGASEGAKVVGEIVVGFDVGAIVVGETDVSDIVEGVSVVGEGVGSLVGCDVLGPKVCPSEVGDSVTGDSVGVCDVGVRVVGCKVEGEDVVGFCVSWYSGKIMFSEAP